MYHFNRKEDIFPGSDKFIFLSCSGGREGDEGWNYDPSEPRYCICNQVSYGDMVACDNVDVSMQHRPRG